MPTPLSRRNKNAHKNDFGHVLILAGSPGMLGAAALAGLAAMRAGAGLATIGVPKSLNTALQKKTSSVVMTWPLPETKKGTLGPAAWKPLQARINTFTAVAVGPGMSQEPATKKLILRLIKECPRPLVIDADALNALAGQTSILRNANGPRVLTPHPGEMVRLTGLKKEEIEKDRRSITKNFAKKNSCVLLLKGHRTVIAAPDGRTSVNTTGNPGMATAGSGDVLTGIIAAFLAQGLPPYEAAKWGALIHGLAGDLAAEEKTPTAMIASDIIDLLPCTFSDRKHGFSAEYTP